MDEIFYRKRGDKQYYCKGCVDREDSPKRIWKDLDRGVPPGQVVVIKREVKVSKEPCYSLAKTRSERQMQSKYKGRCHVCNQEIQPGDWIYWDKDSKSIRHSPDPHDLEDPPF